MSSVAMIVEPRPQTQTITDLRRARIAGDYDEIFRISDALRMQTYLPTEHLVECWLAMAWACASRRYFSQALDYLNRASAFSLIDKQGFDAMLTPSIVLVQTQFAWTYALMGDPRRARQTLGALYRLIVGTDPTGWEGERLISHLKQRIADDPNVVGYLNALRNTYMEIDQLFNEMYGEPAPPPLQGSVPLANYA